MQKSASEQMAPSSATTVGAIVADDFRTARVFEKHGIDFCCGGKTTLAAICEEKGLDLAVLQREIAEVKSAPVERSHNYAAWALPFLADYIVNTHHAYLNENTEQIAAYAGKIAGVHGAHHPEVVEIAAIFARIATDMAAHLREEEEVLFPAIKRVDAARIAGNPPDALDVETIRASLVKLDREHQEIGDAVHAIRHLANGYALPGDVCNTFAVTYRMLHEFEDDLHKHVHLENNILFPKAARL
ncbi:MAG TPA: iron-sulfur cluster repair di-iron protein [Desulfuromonadales bacterium]|nr:iron-sulfur cluster repair di-iron protein [Desulfuromonadales bacterium]